MKILYALTFLLGYFGLIMFVAEQSDEPIEPLPKPDWAIAVEHDNYGKCFAFVMEGDTRKHKYVVDCQDTVRLK